MSIGFSIIPDFIKRDTRLTSNDKLIFAELLRLSNNKNGYAWPSYDSLAEFCGCSRSTAIRSVSTLVKAGLVIKKWSAYRSNRYYIKKLDFKKKTTTNVMSLSFFRERLAAKKKAGAQIISIAARAGFKREDLYKHAVALKS